MVICYAAGGDLATQISVSGHRMRTQSLYVFYTSYNGVYAPAMTCCINSGSTLYLTLQYNLTTCLLIVRTWQILVLLSNIYRCVVRLNRDLERIMFIILSTTNVYTSNLVRVSCYYNFNVQTFVVTWRR